MVRVATAAGAAMVADAVAGAVVAAEAASETGRRSFRMERD
jgi:hypothetical protein